jgi:hypothetical protein
VRHHHGRRAASPARGGHLFRGRPDRVVPRRCSRPARPVAGHPLSTWRQSFNSSLWDVFRGTGFTGAHRETRTTEMTESPQSVLRESLLRESPIATTATEPLEAVCTNNQRPVGHKISVVVHRSASHDERYRDYCRADPFCRSPADENMNAPDTPGTRNHLIVWYPRSRRDAPKPQKSGIGYSTNGLTPPSTCAHPVLMTIPGTHAVRARAFFTFQRCMPAERADGRLPQPEGRRGHGGNGARRATPVIAGRTGDSDPLLSVFGICRTSRPCRGGSR